MEFRTLKQTAETWCHSNGYSLLLADEEERRIVFKNKVKEDITFFVVCPEPGKKSWHVWSDNEDILAHLAQTQDAIGSCKERSLTEVLNMVHKDLTKLVGGAAAAEAAGSDTDEDFDFDGEQEDEEDYDDDDAGYYQEEDVDALEDQATNAVPAEVQESADSYFTGDGSSTAVHRLLADMKNFKKSEGKFGVTGGPRGDNLFLWDVRLTDIPNDTLLGKDLEKYAKAFKRQPVIYLEMKFPKDYPMAPPFVRVLRPRFKFLTGHVTIGGSVCMEMLTRSGWRPTNDIESILVQIRAEIMSDDKARLDTSHTDNEYDEAEARQAFERTVKRYGWDK